MDDNDKRVERYDPFKDFAERKPWWCGGELEVKEYPAYTNYYANFHGGCGCGETQTSMVRLSKDNSISLEERQKDAVQKVLGKVSVCTCRPSSSFHARALRYISRTDVRPFFSSFFALLPAAHARDPHGEGQQGERVQQGDDPAGRAADRPRARGQVPEFGRRGPRGGYTGRVDPVHRARHGRDDEHAPRHAQHRHGVHGRVAVAGRAGQQRRRLRLDLEPLREGGHPRRGNAGRRLGNQAVLLRRGRLQGSGRRRSATGAAACMSGMADGVRASVVGGCERVTG